MLIVDDDEDIRFILRRFLDRDDRFSGSAEAASAAEAFALLDEGCFDLVLLDLMMPGVDGFTALPLIRQRCPEARVVIYSALDDHGVVARARLLGAAGYLRKDLAAPDVVEQLAAIT